MSTTMTAARGHSAATGEPVPPRLELFRLLTAHYVSRSIYVAARLGIADHLASGPRTADELAAECAAHAPSLRRLLRLLASRGVFEEREDGRFALTPLSDCLRQDHPTSSRPTALLFAGPIMRAWDELLYSVQTGEIAFDRVFGKPAFEYMGEHADDAATFNAAMTAGSTVTAAGVPAAYDFGRHRRLVDVGGGHGVLILSILKANPRLHGTVCELPFVAEGARKAIEAAGLTERCDVASGDFFQDIPRGADAYILKSVIHDWDDAKSIRILGNCRRAVTPDGRLLLVELVLPDRIDRSPRSQMGTGSDVNMLVNVGGRERTEEDFRRLLEAAGFRLESIRPVANTMMSVLESAPV
jgi:SAM-dependent methyltransferase